MENAVNDLIDLLDLEEIERNHYRATSPNEGWQRVYGGQVLGQALVAASRTVPDDRIAHSLHGYFLRPGDTSVPILYTVDRIRDGKSFTTRRVSPFSMAGPFSICRFRSRLRKTASAINCRCRSVRDRRI